MGDHSDQDDHGKAAPDNLVAMQHVLVERDGVISCVRCGAFVSHNVTARRLRNACQGKPMTTGLRVHRERFLKGKHPHTGETLACDAKRICLHKGTGTKRIVRFDMLRYAQSFPPARRATV